VYESRERHRVEIVDQSSFGYKVDPTSQVFLPRSFFSKYGLSQASWVTVEHENAYMHLA